MKKQIFTVKVLNVFLAFALALSGVATLVSIEPVQAAPGDNPDGALRIEIQSAYNLVVDSNVSSPPTYAPTSFSVGAKVCNDGTTDLNDVVVNIGTYTNTTTYQAGVYPSRYHNDSTGFSTQHPHLNNPAGAGTYQFKHEGGSAGTADATRYIGAIPAGECRTHYWLLSYPQCENNADGTFHAAPCGSLEPVWGRTNDPNDDLWLEYDIWATSSTGGLLARERHRMTMRNEISAMANKIWPNGDNKVPDAYKQAIQDAFGWDTIPPEGSGLISYPGQRVITTQGIWYDLGNVNQGFDNDGDLVPDYNAWVQPIGDPSSFDPGCFRLIKAYGLIIVKRQGQQETLIPFEDQLYFQNLPPDNTGVVGLVYYQYVAIDGACTAGLSPYQEVASGRDNEKFNADFGAGIPPLTSQAMPDGAINKTADPVQGLSVPGGTITYTITFTNPTDVSLGLPEFGLPIVIQDSIPEGTTYVAGSAAANNTLPAGVTAYIIRYSTNNGATWTTTEPSPASVTDIQWWLSDDLPAGATGTVTFRVTANSGVVFYNVAGIGLGNATPFAYDDAVTFAAGTGTIGGTVFEDNGANFRDGVYQSGDESPIGSVTVTLYISTTNGYVLWDTTTSDPTDGSYLFDELPAGDYKIVVSTDLPSDDHIGWTESTATSIEVTLGVGGVSSGNNFGFAPTLRLTKTLIGGDAYENREVSYIINVTNLIPGGGETVGGTCRYEFWSTTGSTASKPFIDYQNAFAEPDGVYAYGDFGVGTQRWLRGTGFNPVAASEAPAIVEAIFPLYVDQTVPANHYVTPRLLDQNGNQVGGVGQFAHTYLNERLGLSNAAYAIWDVTSNTTWDWDVFSNLTLELAPDKSGGSFNGSLYVDAMGFRVTVNAPCLVLNDSDIIATVPLTDTFDTDLLTFVSANPPHTAINTTTGVITWTNIGPIYPGQTKSVQVNFIAKEPSGNPSIVNNTAATTNPRFADGRLANNDLGSATGNIYPTAEITGVVYSDPNTSRWNYNPASDFGIPNVTVELLACVNNTTGALITNPTTNQNCGGNNGTWEVVDTVITDENGLYEFLGVLPGYYRVRVVASTLPATSFTRTAEAGVVEGTGGNARERQRMDGDQAQGRNCPSNPFPCDDVWGHETHTMTTDNYTPILASNRNRVIGGVNFGYNIQPVVYGTIWHDYNGDGARDAGEDGLAAGITVRLLDSNGVEVATTTTDANGFYQFTDLDANGTYTIEVVTSSLPYTGDPDVEWTNTSDFGPGTDNGNTNHVLGTVTLVAGQISGSYDFGYHLTSGPYEINGTVYADWNGDASQQVGSEPGFAGITVTLYSETGAFITSTLTLADGSYSFGDLITGTYKVVVDYDALPPGYSATQDPDEAGLCVTCDHQATVTVDADSNPVNNVDFGYKPVGAGQIGDFVWRDLNGDGKQDGGRETGIPGVYVWLEITLNGGTTWTRVMTDTTGSNGEYRFTGLPDGSYRVIVDDASGALPTGSGGFAFVPSTPTTHSVTIANGNTYLDADFGFKPLAAIGDTVYWDANGNAEQDWNEEGIPGVTVRLINSNAFAITYQGVEYGPGAVISTTQTANNPTNDPALDPTGFYQFTGLPTGDSSAPYLYRVVVDTSTLPYAAPQTADPDRDGEACTKTDIYPNSGAFACDNATSVRVYPGTNFMGADFGYQPLGVIGDRVWLDFNGNGIQDAGEVGIPGVVVTVTNGTETFTTTTDFDGHYAFVNLGNGTWTVTFETPDGMIGTTSAIGDVLNGNGSVGGSATVVVSGGAVTSINGNTCTGDCGLNIDSGFRYAGTNTLSGTICIDNANQQDGQCGVPAIDSGYTSGVTTGEMALGGITVYAYLCTENPSGTVTGCELVGVTSTGGNGDYTFTGLPTASHNGSTGTFYAISTAVPFPGLGLTTNNTNADIRDGSHTQIGATTVVTTTDLATGYLVSAYQTIRGVFSEGSVIQNVDFAYRSNVAYDFGNLPSTYDGITLLANNGARHATGDLYFGSGVTTEPDAKTNPTAEKAEDDGIVYYPNTWALGGQGVITATVYGESGYFVAWIDWNGNGDFLGTGEFIISSAVVTGTNVLTFTIPSNNVTTNPRIYMRIRLFSEAPLVPELSYVGLATNGEVQDKGFDNPFFPTAISLAAFEVIPQDGAILITWETAMELDNVGFNLYRSTAAAGPYTRLNVTLIPPQFPGEVWGGEYEWLDTDVQPGVVYYYKLEDLDVKGVSTFHGPVSTAAITAPTAVRLQRIDARGVMSPLVLGLVAVLGLWVVRRRRRGDSLLWDAD